jgi:hypothetical protein
MATRLNLEESIKHQMPEIKYIRAHSHRRGIVTLYIWDENLKLDDVLKQKVLSLDLTAHLVFEIKSYDKLSEDDVPIPRSIPKEVMFAAVFGELNKKGIEDTMKKIFPHIQVDLINVDSSSGTIHFNAIGNVTDIEKELIRDYIEELTPIDFRCSVMFN